MRTTDSSRAANSEQAREEDRELLRRYHKAGDTTAREELIERHLPLVRSLARRYAGRGEALEDIEQVGAIGLIKARGGTIIWTGDAADDQAHDGLEVARQRRFEIDSFLLLGQAIVPSPTTQSSRIRQASCPGAATSAASASSSSSVPSGALRTRQSSGRA